MHKPKHLAPFASSLTMVLAITATAVITLTGCAPGKNDMAPWVAPEYVQHPVLGRIDKAEVALVGPDANENGIRDQLDTYIASQIAPNAQSAAKAYSLALTRAIIEGKRGAPSPATNLAVGTAAQCVVVSSNAQTMEALAKLTVNTTSRIDALARFRAANAALATTPACV